MTSVAELFQEASHSEICSLGTDTVQRIKFISELLVFVVNLARVLGGP